MSDTTTERSSGEKRRLPIAKRQVPWWGQALILLLGGGGASAGIPLLINRGDATPAAIEIRFADQERRIARTEATTERLTEAVQSISVSVAVMQSTSAATKESVDRLVRATGRRGGVRSASGDDQ